MESTTRAFKENSRAAVNDAHLQLALSNLRKGFIDKRGKAVGKLPEFEALRDQGRDIKAHVLENLDFYLEEFEARVTEKGGRVHWCQTGAEAREAILAICREAGAKTATKGKSMISEEIGLNPFLDANGIEPVETDLGEYIIQLAGEPPSHIIAPAIHKTQDDVADLFVEHHGGYGKTKGLDEARALVDEGRQILRQKFNSLFHYRARP